MSNVETGDFETGNRKLWEQETVNRKHEIKNHLLSKKETFQNMHYFPALINAWLGLHVYRNCPHKCLAVDGYPVCTIRKNVCAKKHACNLVFDFLFSFPVQDFSLTMFSHFIIFMISIFILATVLFELINLVFLFSLAIAENSVFHFS